MAMTHAALHTCPSLFTSDSTGTAAPWLCSLVQFFKQELSHSSKRGRRRNMASLALATLEDLGALLDEIDAASAPAPDDVDEDQAKLLSASSWAQALPVCARVHLRTATVEDLRVLLRSRQPWGHASGPRSEAPQAAISWPQSANV
jgi:hypothetical protein